MARLTSRALGKALSGIRDVSMLTSRVKQIVDKNEPADSPGAYSYHMHARRNLALAKKDPRIGLMIRG